MTETVKGLILAEDLHQASTAVIVASSASAGAPASNLADMRPGQILRFTGATGETIRVDHGASVTADTVVIVNHDASLDGTVRLTITENSDYSDDGTYQQTHDLWPPVFGLGEGGLGQYMGGYVPPEDRGAFLPYRPLRLKTAGGVLSQFAGRYWEYSFTDASHSTGLFSVGYVMAGTATQFATNFGYPFDIDEVDPSEIEETDGGAVIVTEREAYGAMRLEWPALSRSQGLTAVRALKRLVGRKRPVFAMLFPDTAEAELYQTSIFGIFEDYSPTRHSALDRASQSFTIRGLI